MISMRARWTAALAGIFLAGPLHAQWLVEVAAGSVAHDVAGISSTTSSNNLMLGVRHEGPRWLYVSTGLPIASNATPWAAVGVGGREPALRAGRATLGLDWSGHAHAYRTAGIGTGTGFTVAALPFVRAALGALTLEARSGPVHYSTSLAGDETSRTGHDSGLTTAAAPWPDLTVLGEARLLRTSGAAYPYLGVGAELELGAGTVWAYGGHWSDVALPDPAWGAGATLDLAHSISLRASFQQDATDPLYWNDTRRYWSIGVSRSLGADPARSFDVPVTPVLAGGRVVFRVPADDGADAPSIAGDFNGWKPVEMRRDGDHWVAAVRVAPGVYHYAFRSAEGEWFVPDAVPNRVDDGFGGTNAVLVVPERSRR